MVEVVIVDSDGEKRADVSVQEWFNDDKGNLDLTRFYFRCNVCGFECDYINEMEAHILKEHGIDFIEFVVRENG